ncbi:MAG: hypothetical protein IPQ19_15315 [Bacteroidetes bacterium]|nr:hypothetical protein [Bacteroidota bacterium]
MELRIYARASATLPFDTTQINAIRKRLPSIWLYCKGRFLIIGSARLTMADCLMVSIFPMCRYRLAEFFGCKELEFLHNLENYSNIALPSRGGL